MILSSVGNLDLERELVFFFLFNSVSVWVLLVMQCLCFLQTETLDFFYSASISFPSLFGFVMVGILQHPTVETSEIG